MLLVVEDDPAFARILYDLAHELGFDCLIAGTADEGALMARQYLPNAVILDIGLPDRTGLSVLDRIKRDPRTRHIRVHVVLGRRQQPEVALAGGAIGYMLKPVRRDQLVGVLEGLEAHLTRRLRRVLVVEDDAQQAESVRLLLASRDVETVDAHSAAAALEQLGSETFDCMVLDLNLPDMPGLRPAGAAQHGRERRLPAGDRLYRARPLGRRGTAVAALFQVDHRQEARSRPSALLDEVTLFLHQVVSDLPEQQQAILSQALQRDAALDGRHILVVEDDIRNVYALTSIFEPHGAKVQIARNGIEALAALDARRRAGRPGRAGADGRDDARDGRDRRDPRDARPAGMARGCR